MPVYEYGCTKCGKRTEVLQKFSDAPLTVCEACGGELKKLISNTSFVLKGTGWYVTDYTDKKSASTSGGKSPSKPAEAKTEDTKSEPAVETKPEPKKEEVSAG